MVRLQEVEGWARGLEELHARIALHASLAQSIELGCWHTCRDYSAQSSARMGGSWLNKLVKRARMACSAC